MATFPDIELIDQTEEAVLLRHALGRIRDFLQAHGAEDFMLGVIDHLREENEQWIVPEIEQALREGKLTPPVLHA